MLKRYLSIVETAADCRAVISWAQKQRKADLTIIALSLDSLAYLKQEKPEAHIKHVWEILPMENLIDRGYHESLRLSESWVKHWSGDANDALDVAAQGTLHMNVLLHSVAAALTAEALAEFIKKESYCYVAAPASYTFYGPYYPNLQSAGRDNFIFKSTLLEILSRQNLPVLSLSSFNTWLLRRLSWLRRWLFVKKLAYDIIETVRSKIQRRPPIETLLSSAPQATLLSSPWGKELSRMLNYPVFTQELKTAKISHLDLIWRPKKVVLPENTGVGDQYLIVRENISKGAGYGPQISMFRLSMWPAYFRFLRQAVRPRLHKARSFFAYQSLTELFSHNLVYAYREAFLTTELMKRVLEHTKPNIFLGSDSDSPSARAEILAGQAVGIRTLSTPHGYQAYSIPLYNYLADTVLTHSSATADILAATGVPRERIRAIGSSHLRRTEAPVIDPKSVRIVIGTRSWGGIWPNFASRHDAYDKELRGLIHELLKNSANDIVIKSHPNGDYHEYYDFLVGSFANPRFHHVPKGWKVEQFRDSTDILVCMGEMPSLFISALYLKIPIVFITGTMTKTQAALNYDYKGLGCVVETTAQAAEEIKKISHDRGQYDAVMAKQNEFAKRYDQADPEQELIHIIKKL